jgi:hypothetical protein
MQRNYNKLFIDFPDESEVWVYSADRFLIDQEVELLSNQLTEFTQSWETHGKPLKADYAILDNVFILLVTDSLYHKASGCSIDSSVRVLKKMGQEMGINFFNRLQLVVQKNETIKHVPYHELENYTEWSVADTTIKTLAEFKTRFFTPVKESEFSRK